MVSGLSIAAKSSVKRVFSSAESGLLVGGTISFHKRNHLFPLVDSALPINGTGFSLVLAPAVSVAAILGIHLLLCSCDRKGELLEMCSSDMIGENVIIQ